MAQFDDRFVVLKWLALILLLIIGLTRFVERDLEGLLIFVLSVGIFYLHAAWGLLNKSLFFLIGAIILFGIGYWWKWKGEGRDETI
jgi:uncharacterized membrane protein